MTLRPPEAIWAARPAFRNVAATNHNTHKPTAATRCPQMLAEKLSPWGEWSRRSKTSCRLPRLSFIRWEYWSILDSIQSLHSRFDVCNCSHIHRWVCWRTRTLRTLGLVCQMGSWRRGFMLTISVRVGLQKSEAWSHTTDCYRWATNAVQLNYETPSIEEIVPVKEVNFFLLCVTDKPRPD